MQFALIGIDRLARRLVLELNRSQVHSLVAAYLSPEEAQEFGGLIPEAAQADDWESLLVRRGVDAVIVASGQNSVLREEQLKRLVQEAMPIILVHPACDVMFAYELEMIRREAGGVIVPVAPDWWHPGMDRLAQWLRDMSHRASVEQVAFQRSLADRSREEVLKQFIRDVWPIRRLIGPVKNISAAGGSIENASLANLNVHCSGETGVPASWSVVSPTMDPMSRISIIAANEMAILQIPGGDAPWTFEARGTTTIREQLPVWDWAPQVLDRVEHAIRRKTIVPSWSDACMDLEAADSVQKSLRRKRAVDLHTSEASEDQNFKGYMAAAGCLILVIILLGFLILSVVEGFRMPLQETPSLGPPGDKPDREKWSLWLRLWPVYPLVAFLMLQFLLLLAKRPTAKAKNADDQQPSGEGND